MKIEIKNRWTNEVIFSHDCENNTIKITVLEAVKSGANLNGADLSGAYLSDADLSGADLRRAELSGAYLRRADLSDANLSGANLRDADLRRAYLSGADLSGAYLIGADLSYADLRRADLSGADLRRADLSGAYLSDVKISESTAFFSISCPEEGSFIAYKKADNKIVKLLITEDAKRSSATSLKCRCSKAIILSIESIDKSQTFDSVVSNYDSRFVYKVGETVEVTNFDENRFNECSTGIHFFINRINAEQY